MIDGTHGNSQTIVYIRATQNGVTSMDKVIRMVYYTHHLQCEYATNNKHDTLFYRRFLTESRNWVYIKNPKHEVNVFLLKYSANIREPNVNIT